MTIYKGQVWNKGNKDSLKIYVIDYLTTFEIPFILNEGFDTLIIGQGSRLSHASIVSKELGLTLIFQPQITTKYNRSKIAANLDFNGDEVYIDIS